MVVNRNLDLLGKKVSESQPLIGVEPSGILTFRDEALDLAQPHLRDTAHRIAPHCLMVEEFIAREIEAGRIISASFTAESRTVHLHGHCFQKALAGTSASETVLTLPQNYEIEVIPSGCCGMAGSFGYEKEHFDVSMQIGELVLFPAVRNASDDAIIAAPGTSCRHQIHDGTGRHALHPVEVLHAAFK